MDVAQRKWGTTIPSCSRARSGARRPDEIEVTRRVGKTLSEVRDAALKKSKPRQSSCIENRFASA